MNCKTNGHPIDNPSRRRYDANKYKEIKPFLSFQKTYGLSIIVESMDFLK